MDQQLMARHTFPYTRASTLAISSCSSVHSRQLPATVSDHTLNDARGSRDLRRPSTPSFSGLPAQRTARGCPLRNSAIKSVPPCESGTCSKPAMISRPVDSCRSGKSFVTAWETWIVPKCFRRRYSATARTSCPCSFGPRILAPSPITSMPKSASNSPSRSLAFETIYPCGCWFPPIVTVLN
jgi:hypothetical protein